MRSSKYMDALAGCLNKYQFSVRSLLICGRLCCEHFKSGLAVVTTAKAIRLLLLSANVCRSTPKSPKLPAFCQLDISSGFDKRDGILEKNLSFWRCPNYPCHLCRLRTWWLNDNAIWCLMWSCLIMTIGKSSMMTMNMGTGLRVSLKRKCKPVSKIIAQEGEGPACDNVCPYSRKFRTSAIPGKMVCSPSIARYARMRTMMTIMMIFEGRRRR